MASFLYFISWEIIFIIEILIIIKWLLILQSLLIYIVYSQIIIQMYGYLAMLTIFLNYYIILVDTTLNGGTKSGTEVSSFNIYLMCVSFIMPVDKLIFNTTFHVKHCIFIWVILYWCSTWNMKYQQYIFCW